MEKDEQEHETASDEKRVVDDVESASTTEGTLVTRTILKHSHDADEAMKAYEGIDPEDLIIDEATNKRLLRKIDLVIMPILCLIYGMQYLDKTTLSYASVMGLRSDIHLRGDNYQWLGSMFYFGYLAWEWPTNMLLQRLPLGKYSAANIILWGVVLACFAAVENFSGAVAIRFFLGVLEASVSPGFTFLTSQWYTKREQGFRVGFWFSFNGWAQLVGGFIAYGIAVGCKNNGCGIAPWKIVFLATGLVTAALGLAFLFLVPDSQLNAWFLDKTDRVRAIERIRKNEQGIGNKTFKLYQLKEALTDPLVWLLVLYSLVADIPNGGISNFFSQLIVSFGYTETESLLYGTPGGAIEVVTIVGFCLLGYFYGYRLMWGACSMAIAFLGMVLIVALENGTGRLVGYYLTQASATGFAILLGLIGTNISGYTKKTTAAAMYLIAYCVGNLIGPQVFRPQAAPRYLAAEIVICVCYGSCVIILMIIWAYWSWMNEKKRRIREAPGYVKLEKQEFLDLTDLENPELIYAT